MSVCYYVEVKFPGPRVAPCLLLCVVFGCQEPRPSKAGSPGVHLDNSASASSNGAGGEAGAVGSDGAGDSEGGASAGSTDATGAGATGAGAAGGGGSVSACAGNRAFGVVSGVFVEPTPAELAARLSQESYDVSPVSLVLFASTEATLAVSYTVGKGRGRAWPASRRPTPAAAWVGAQGFGSSAAEEEGWMLVEGAAGQREIRLRNVRVTATTDADCATGTATLVAVVPGEWSRVLNEVAPGSVSEEARDRGGRAPDVTLSAELSFEAVEFDFGGAPSP